MQFNRLKGKLVNRRQLNRLVNSGIFIATLIFLTLAIENNLQELTAIRFQNQAWLYGGAALGTSLLAHFWSAFVWVWILEDLHQSVPWRWAALVFLKNSPAKYLPGNIWHLYGRVRAAQKVGIVLEIATFSVLLEPLLIAAAALTLTILSALGSGLQGLSLVVILLGIHPRVLNPVLDWIAQQKKQPAPVRLRHYPLRVLLGEIGFMGLRSISFLITALALTPLNWETLRPLVGGFSFAWLLGLVTPGAPGGLGVFEATAIALLDEFLAPGLLLGVVALYRLESILAEVVGAAFAWFLCRRGILR